MQRWITVFALLASLVCSTSGIAQDDVAMKLIDRLEKDNLKLVDENETLKRRIKELESAIAKLNKQIAEGGPKKKGDKEALEAEDPFELGSVWTGELNGRNPTDEFHQAMSAKITARDTNSFQLRTLSEEVEWLYDLKVTGKKLSLTRAEVLRAPDGFVPAVGVAKIGSSVVTTGFSNGLPWIKMHIIRPVRNSGVDAVIELKREVDKPAP